MDFGRVDNIAAIDFTFPNEKEIRLTPSEAPLNVYVGPPIWSNKAWIGKIYPSNAKDSELLYYYCRQFNTIELNVTHYQIPDEATIKRWKNAATPDFKFCPKFPQLISHDKQLIGVDTITHHFLSSVAQLEQNLGVSFLQLPPTFSPNHFQTLKNFVSKLTKEVPVSIEFRHPEWFSNRDNWKRTIDLLSEHQIATVITDVAGRRDVLHQSLSTNTLLLRFVGNDLHSTDYSRTLDWIKQLDLWHSRGLSTIYVFIHSGENLLAPELSTFWIENLNKTLHSKVTIPSIRPQVVQTSLF